MRIDTAKKREGLNAERDVNQACRQRLEDYLARTGLSTRDFAHRINYALSTLNLFIADNYEQVGRTAHNLVSAIDSFIATHPVEPMTSVEGELYDTANVRAIHDLCEQLLPRPVAYMLYAPPGSQKTFVLEHEVARINAAEMANAKGARAFYVYARQGIRPRDFVRRIAQACGCRVANDIDTMLNNIRFEFRSRRVLLIIDEAQHLDLESLETIRELLDRPPYVSLLLAGSHDLKRKFDEFSATLEQWNSRIIAKVRLPGLERAEAVGVIQREIGELLDTKSKDEADKIIAALITGATTRDAFENNRSYINVRTLTNALAQVRAASITQLATVPEEAA